MKPNSVAILTGMGIGDMLYAMGFVNAYLDKNPEQNVLIVARSKHTEIINSFGEYDFFAITKVNVGSYSALLHCTDLHRLEPNIISTYQLPNNKQVNIIDKMRDLFGIDSSIPIQCHNLMPRKVSSIPSFYENCDRIVVLNPYSISGHYPQEIINCLEELVQYLNVEGYTVYCNVIKDQIPICGTRKLCCDLAEFVEIARYIPFIISVRSGILDLVVKTNVNMFVIYDGDEGAKLYGLEKWQCKGLLKEITIDQFLQDRDFVSVMTFIHDLNGKN